MGMWSWSIITMVSAIIDAPWIRRQVCHSHYGPWDHIPPHVWTHKSNSDAMQDEGEDEADVCELCCQKRSTVTICGECCEHYYDKCIDAHTFGEQLVY